ncbi:gluconate 2-dehydrogenase subunit 3 family protein [Roseomonas sp. NAR14]|uniref:Gluconate 2-dehydrogenase subunit 3 family protein n=1 Tax=Roseomonas acroporae TaxID=2937791 RepID=A0A9X1YDF0_9PROT|nr:gluconate 2-dehydrogenase subunit 3 family protein [Roseomonas acroporae]MCK8788106.1 gluconate 2-dehydrogenase subunit 3 family protein [Roseomonas acroporae]
MSNGSLPSDRRGLMKLGAALLPALAGLEAGHAGIGRAEAGTPPAAAPAAYAPGYFTATEWRFLHAFCDRLIPADETGPGAVEAGVPEFIDRQLATPWGFGKLWYMEGPFVDGPPELGVQSPLTPRDLYRQGIAAVEASVRRAQGRAFAELDAAARDAVLHALDKGETDLGPALPSAYFFASVLQDTLHGYFADPVHGGNRGMGGWKMVGFPGARGDFWDWVDRHDGRPYPLPPMSITGRRA